MNAEPLDYTDAPQRMKRLPRGRILMEFRSLLEPGSGRLRRRILGQQIREKSLALVLFEVGLQSGEGIQFCFSGFG
jgi:hypothetical protein